MENFTLRGELFTVISQQQVIELHYHTFADADNLRQIALHPYILKEYNLRWYLIAAATDTDKLLNFSLDRIDKVVPLQAYKYVPYDGDLKERFEHLLNKRYHKF